MKLMRPQNMRVAEVARKEGISEQTLSNWRNQAKLYGKPMLGRNKASENRSSVLIPSQTPP